MKEVDLSPTPINDKQRTLKQNRALHKYFELVATALNDAGLDMRAVLKPEVEIPWNKITVKEHLWRPVQKIQLHKESTIDLEKKEIDDVFKTVNLYLSKNHGVTEPFPSIEEIMKKMEEKTK
jgi:hypothetical protein